MKSHNLRRLQKAIRKSLDGLEIRCAAFDSAKPTPHTRCEALCNQLRGKIAIVKQEVYQDFYCCSAGRPPQETLASTLFRSGPVSLLTELEADFWIVKLEEDPECTVWRQKVTDCQQAPEEFYLSLRTEPFKNGQYGHQKPQGHFAISCGSIDWAKYKVVISYDIAVPARVTRKYPQVIWCYCIGEPCMGVYKSSVDRPVEGYDLFLNQRFRRIRLLPKPARHVVEFPYFVQNYGCFHKALGLRDDPAERSGVFAEAKSKSILSEDDIKSLSRFGPLRWPVGIVPMFLRELMRSKYFLILEGRKWGNAMVEAIAAGCLALGIPEGQHNVSLFTPRTTCRSFEAILRRIEFFESNREAFEAEVWRQRSLLDRFCFERPFRDLLQKGTVVQAGRNGRFGNGS
jgi:hypothetical protein